MKRIIILTLPLAVLLLGSCHNRAIVTSHTIKDSVFVSHDTTRSDSAFIVNHAINLPPVIITKTITVPCPDAEVHYEEKQGNLTAEVHISKGKMTVKCKEDALRDSIAILQHKYKEVINNVNNRTKQETTILKEPYVHIATAIDKFCYWVTALSLAVVALWLWKRFK